MLNYYFYKNWWSYGHTKNLGQMNRGILGAYGNQYPTGIEDNEKKFTARKYIMLAEVLTLK